MLLTLYSRSRCANISSGLNDHVQVPTLWLFVFVSVVVGGGGGGGGGGGLWWWFGLF